MSTTTTPRALREYRALDVEARRAYNPAGKPGAEAGRRLQEIARAGAALRVARRQKRTNPEYPDLRLNAAKRAVEDVAARGTALPRDAARQYHLLPIGAQDAEIAESAARADHPRRKNWLSPGPVPGTTKAGACRANEIAYKGRHKGRFGANYAPLMRALARLSLDGAILTAMIGHSDGGRRPEAAYTVQAGRGYQWQADANGVRLVRLADGADYHPTTDEVRAGRAAIVAALRERAATRKAAAKVARREAAILKHASRDGIWVCLGDSVAAGNCRAGTENFARRHNLDTRRHYRADALPAPATGDESRRLALAVLAAQRRQARELAAGFCAI